MSYRYAWKDEFVSGRRDSFTVASTALFMAFPFGICAGVARPHGTAERLPAIILTLTWKEQ